ncbi:MAG: hypothetical protein R2715_03625 [Ilumatobacteraceae bacterium]
MTETYAGNRLVHDADAHLSEHDGFYEPYADPAIRPRLAALDGGSGGRDVSRAVERIRLAHRSENRMAALAGNPGEVLMYKDLAALGAFDPQDRVEGARSAGVPQPIDVHHDLPRGAHGPRPRRRSRTVDRRGTITTER